MVVQHNLTAMNANRYLGINNNKLSKSLEKLSSGYAINRAGDNAAGLAVSEKMRSQIAGMTQGVKNAQDGISMVQTFEGALTETHSILQRMKTLADQMANGSYDDPVDRAASQREFLQLNDELNQIADTDFNGVIVLNGGRMADGLKQVDGKFDYANKADQLAAENSEKLIAAQAEAQSKIDAATKKVAAAQKALNNTKVDLSNAGAAAEWNTVDNNLYGATEAAYVFGTVTKYDTNGDAVAGTGEGGLRDADDKNLADYGATEVTVTFEYDGEGTWTGIKASALDKDGNAIAIANPEFLLGNDNDKNLVAGSSTGLGGFNVVTEDGDETTANAIFDSTKAKKGDTVTLVFTNNASETVAPRNIGMDANSLDTSNLKGVPPTGATTIQSLVKDSDMTEEIAGALKTLDNAFVEITYSGTTASFELMDENDVTLPSKFAIDSTGKITYTTDDGKEVDLAKITAAKGTEPSNGDIPTAAKSGVAGTFGGTNAPGTTVTESVVPTVTWIDDGAGNAGWSTNGKDIVTGDVTIGTSTLAGTTSDVTVAWADLLGTDTNFNVGDSVSFAVTGTNGNGVDKNAEMTVVATLNRLPGETSGTMKFGIAVDAFNYSSDGGYTVKAGKDTAINSEAVVAKQNALDKAKAELQAAKDAYPMSLPKGVSTSDAFNKSEAKLTYKDNITLQVGARTKDAVNFTFTYDSDVIGELKGDLDCTAAGLGTDKLTIATQEDANYAIDKIDQAINKVSLIRGNFGAIQNRLEHKIDNMNVSIENLTSAESQIRDTNMPQEMMNFTKQQILAQASQSMLAQANQLPQSVLSLLQ